MCSQHSRRSSAVRSQRWALRRPGAPGRWLGTGGRSSSVLYYSLNPPNTPEIQGRERSPLPSSEVQSWDCTPPTPPHPHAL